MESLQQQLSLKTIQRGQVIYYDTLSVYKYLGLSSHQKMKEKAIRLGLEIIVDEELGTCLTEVNLLNLLRSYQLTLRGDRLTQVNLMLNHLSKDSTLPNQEVKPTVNLNGSQVKPSRQKVYTVHPVLNQDLPQVKWYEHSLNTLSHFIQALSVFLKTEQFIFMVLTGALIIQINHVAVLFIRAAGTSTNLSWVSAYLYGTVAELTALLLTIHRGKQSILRTFALLTFWVNLLYYQVWLNFSPTLEWFTQLLVKITLSAFLAFVIYSYTHLFTQKLSKN
jgi:hypothetical protein